MYHRLFDEIRGELLPRGRVNVLGRVKNVEFNVQRTYITVLSARDL